MACRKLSLVLLTWVLFLSMAAERSTGTGENLAARLQAGGGIECWNSLLELRACTNEIILFFLNGEVQIGPSCCVAIRVIENQCWPSMLLSLGFTIEEGDILRGYCDASLSLPSPPPPPPRSKYLGPVTGPDSSQLGGGTP